MLHLTRFGTDCSVARSSRHHLSLSIHATHPSIIHKRGGKGKEWGNVRARHRKAQTLAIAFPLMHFAAGHTDAPKTAGENPTATRYPN